MASDSTPRRVGRLVLVVAVGAVAFAAAWGLFVVLPAGNLAYLLGAVLAVLVALAGLRAGGSVAGALVPAYDVAEVAVEGPITRSTDAVLPAGSVGASADNVVEQIRRADDSAAEALLLKLNTPGGEVVPSDDIRLAAEAFDGPTAAYATDVCASGGYWIAAGCEHVVAREGSLVGSIGVIGSRVNAAGLADKLGLDYERLAAGEFKDAGTPLKELEDREREYLQGLVDDYYRAFVERVSAGRDLDPEDVRDTEARVYLGREAREVGLVDAVGTRDDAVDHLADALDRPVSVETFEVERPLRVRVARGAAATAAGAVAGVARALGKRDRYRFR